MANTNIFELAARGKYRFKHNGMISTEDLWDLKLEDLNKIYQGLMKERKEAETESLLETKNSVDVVRDNKIEIIKHIVAVKKSEAEEKAKEKENKERRQYIMGIIQEKKNEALKNMSVEELEKLI